MYTAEDVRKLNERVQTSGRFLEVLRAEVGKVIVGQSYMVDRLLIGLLCNGHVLLEGVPGLAKTLTIKSLARPFMQNSAVYNLHPICCLPM